MKKNLVYSIIAGVVVFGGMLWFITPRQVETPNVVNHTEPIPSANAIPDIAERFIGEWMSEDDTQYRVIYARDGMVYEHYGTGDDALMSTGTWSVTPNESGRIILTTTIADEKYVYDLVVFDGTRMTLREQNANTDNHFIRK